MSIPLEHDRMAQLLMAYDHGVDADQARARLEGAHILVTTDAGDTSWGQAALQAIAVAGTRMFRSGVFIEGIGATPVLVGPDQGRSLRRCLLDRDCRDKGMPAGPFRIHVGMRPPGRVDLFVMADGWRGMVSPFSIEQGDQANVVSGAMAGALAVSEAFRKLVLDDLLACRRPIQLSAWDPANPLAGGPITRVPQSLWQLGLGNLGQALMFVLELLPFTDRAETLLLLQDKDRIGEENRLTQVLTRPDWVGRKKARAVADHAERAGFSTTIDERAFGEEMLPAPGEPQLALVGVDNLKTRRHAAAAGFGLVLDAGLGRSAEEIFDIRLHAFPGHRTPDMAWPPVEDTEGPMLNPGLEKLVAQRRLDPCGAMTIAGQSQGVPSTALVAACLQVGQMCRVLVTGKYSDFVDVTLVNPDRIVSTDFDLPDSVSLPAWIVS